jgi:cobalt transporter subunit CbtA
MALFRSIVFAAALAGLAAGLFATVAQMVGTVPLILEAETFEHAAAGHDHGDSADAAWAPRDGLERTLFTTLANLVTGVAFALLLVAAYAVSGRAIGWREGLFWGMAGFAVFSLAPFLGLPPGLPGMPEAPLGARQVWWLATVAATAGGLALIAFRATPLGAAAGVVLLVTPHLVGAPSPPEAHTAVPETLARSFVVAVTVTSFLFWVVLGVTSAVFYRHLGPHRDAARAG